jgi:hypothetical protein
MLGNYRVAAQLVASRVVLSSTELVSERIIRIIKSRRMRWAGHVARMGEKRNVYRLLVGKPEEKRPLGRHGNKSSGSIKFWETTEWLHNPVNSHRFLTI